MLRTLPVELAVLGAKVTVTVKLHSLCKLSKSTSSTIGTRVHFRPESVRIIGIEPFYVMHLLVNVTFLWITLAAAERRRVSPRAPAPPPLRPIPLQLLCICIYSHRNVKRWRAGGEGGPVWMMWFKQMFYMYPCKEKQWTVSITSYMSRLPFYMTLYDCCNIVKIFGAVGATNIIPIEWPNGLWQTWY